MGFVASIMLMRWYIVGGILLNDFVQASSMLHQLWMVWTMSKGGFGHVRSDQHSFEVMEFTLLSTRWFNAFNSAMF